MKTLKYFLVVLIVSVTPVVSSAQTVPPPPQLLELIHKAFNNYPRLKQGNELIKLSEEQERLAKAGYMPTISADASYRYGKPTPSIEFPFNGALQKIQFVPENNYDMHVGATIPIWDFGRTEASVKKTLVAIQTAKDNFSSAQQLLAGQVAQLYFYIIYLNKSIEVENDQIKLLEQNEKIIDDRVKDGDALKFDLLTTQVKKNNAQNLLIDMQASLKKQYQMLNMLTADNGDGYITRTDLVPEEVPTTEISVDNNLDLISLNDQLQQNEWDIKSAKRGWLPSLSARAQIGYQNGYVPEINKLLLTYSAGVGLNIPIYSAARPNYQTTIAKINLQAAKYNVELQRITLNKDILNTQRDIEATQSKLKNYAIQIDQAKEALNLANIRFKAGVITNLEYLTAQTSVQDAELGKAQLQYNLLISKISIIRQGGKNFW